MNADAIDVVVVMLGTVLAILIPYLYAETRERA